MQNGDGGPERVNLPAPLPVLLFYTTAFVAPDGTVGFYDDIYDHDQRLEQALAKSAARKS
jgi:murein L,D-transpeptidase YcbB/YkuD